MKKKELVKEIEKHLKLYEQYLKSLRKTKKTGTR
ncbi:hypothetical protein Tfer_2562 [Thermincola ferriacetica]|uniref:Uncharacterized protein n=2 Tax=Thermincola TaxID=278993 RepID=D5XAV1_THEPJ|nr:hypothetical protein TherJR_2466 [Thermincola potens JR]KNZ68839.1 hypothetical protein Tfer_2562 [Thermincola ferriacetica]